MILLVTVLCSYFAYAIAQDANCDFQQNVQVGVTYNVYSPGYPANYTRGVTCRWVANCPTGYNCRLDCPEVNLPQSSGCSMDRLLISKTGDVQLVGAASYCGYGSLSATSTAQRLSIGLVTSTSSPVGGRFLCTLRAIPASTTDLCQCGYKKSTRIVGGQETGINEYTFMVAIVDRIREAVKCGAVILDNWRVLTAAHCVINKLPADLMILVGEHDVTQGESPATQGLRVASLQTHPYYNPSNYDYDVAIVTSSTYIAFSSMVGPVCLPYKFYNYDLTGRTVTMLGWGTLFPGGPTSNTLQKVDVQVTSQASCRSQMSSVTDRQMCTYAAGKDACQDDSGGPVLYTDPSNGRLYSVGIISYGKFCASTTPGINTRVTTVLDWIGSVTGVSYCTL